MESLSKKIAEWLNENESVSDELTDGEVIVVLGVELKYSEDFDVDSEDVSADLAGGGVLLTRDGKKEFSYGSWVGTFWVTDWLC